MRSVEIGDPQNAFLLNSNPEDLSVKHLDLLKYLYYKKKNLLNSLMLELQKVRDTNYVKENQKITLKTPTRRSSLLQDNFFKERNSS